MATNPTEYNCRPEAGTSKSFERGSREASAEHADAMSDTTTDSLSHGERQLLDTFVELADTLVEDFDLVDFLCGLTERVVALEIAAEAGILLADESGVLQFIAASHERTQMLELFQVEYDEGPCQDCFTTGEPVSVPDLSDTSERWPLFTTKALALGFRSVQAVPLRLRGNVLGAMNLFLTEPGGITTEGLAVVQAMADIATIGVLQQRELHRAHTVEGQLQWALQSRIGIEQAKGIVAEQGQLGSDAAFDLLRLYARTNNRKLIDVARAVVDGTTTATELKV